MKSVWILLGLLAIGIAVMGLPKLTSNSTETSSGKITAITDASVYTLGVQGKLDHATILLQGGYIMAVGTDIAVPPQSEIIDASGMIVTPGLMHANTYFGLSEITKTKDSNDHSAKGSLFGASFDIKYGLNYRSSVIEDNRRHGLTHVLSHPTSADDLFLGSGAIIHLSGTPDMSVQAGPMIAKLSVGANRSVFWMKLNRIFSELQAFQKNGTKGASYLLDDYDMKALLPVLEGKQKMLLEVSSEIDLRQAILFKVKFDIDLVLLGATEAWRLAPELALADIPVIINPRDNLPDSFGTIFATGRNAALLHKAGVRFAIIPGKGNAQIHTAHHIAEAAGTAVRNGLPWEEALKAITLYPAQILGVEGIGAIEPGMVANIVIWDGDPLQVTTNPVNVIVAGNDIALISRRTLLRDKYIRKNKAH